jgi:protein-disulfide isomerase
VSLTTSRVPRSGPADASVRLVEFFDPNCPHCRRMHQGLFPQMRQRIPTDSVAVYFRPYPLSKKSRPQLYALYYAEEVGQFLRLLDVMYTLGPPSQVSRKALGYMAKAADLRPDSTFAAVRDGRYADRLRRSVEVGRSVGVEGTPTLFLNGRQLTRSSYNPRCLARLIREQL